MTARTLRGAAAIVGVVDDVSPTGELDRHGRALEAAMVRAALDDAGLDLADVDGVAYAGMATGLAEYLGHPPPVRRRDHGRAGRPTSCTSSTRPPPSPPGSATWSSACTPRRRGRDRKRRGRRRPSAAPAGR